MNESCMSDVQSDESHTTSRIARHVFLDMTEVVRITENTIVKYLSIVINSKCSTVDIDRNL